MNKHSYTKRTVSAILAHKVLSLIILVAVLGGGYEIYRSAAAANAAPQYTLAMAHLGTLTQTVTGTGQVSASNQTDIQSQVSGTIQTIDVSVGQQVSAGQLIATIDSTNAQIALDNAKISFAKLQEPAKATDISNAKSSLAKSYNDAYNTVATTFSDLPNIMNGMTDILYTQTGFLSGQQSSYLSSTAQTYRQTAGENFDKANLEYQTILGEFKTSSRTDSNQKIDQLLSDTQTMMKAVTQALVDSQNAINFIINNQPSYNKTAATSAATNINNWSSTANSDLANIVSIKNTILSNENSLTNLTTGADQYDIQASKLNLAQAQRTYDNYFIRAPYDGIIGRIPVNVYGQASGSTVMATIVGTQKIATISLDEVDAAKVQVGQPVSITFDAIDNFTATGTVETVDQVGTVSQGVVSYGVKILINTADPRIKPGMSVNTTITTNTLTNVVLVPTTAVKTLNKTSYVSMASTSPNASSTRQFSGNFGGRQSQTRTITLSSSDTPQQVTIVTGLSDDTNTVIVSGLKPGDWVITKTVSAANAVSTTATPSILSSLGGRGVGGGGGTRTSSGASPARTN